MRENSLSINVKVKIENIKQLEVVLLSKDVNEIILSRDSFAESELPKLVDRIKKSGRLAWVLMERISRYEENMKSINSGSAPNKVLDLRTSTDKIFDIKNLDGIIIQNIDSYAYALRKINKASNDKLKMELNYTMNCYNDETKKVHQTLYNEKRENANVVPLLFTAPVELNIYELSEVGYDTFIAYSYIDTMVTANCLRKNVGKGESICKNRFDFNKVQDFAAYIIDRKGKKLHYKTYCKYCYNKIFNTEPLYLLDKAYELIGENSKLTEKNGREMSLRIDFSFENEDEVKNILNKKIPDSFTRGHFKNSIR